MIRTKKTFFIVMFSLIAILLTSVFALGFTIQGKAAENNIYTVNYNDSKNGLWNHIVSRLEVSEEAEWVKFEYEITSKEGTITHFGMGRGAYDNATGRNTYIYANATNAEKFVESGIKYSVIYYLDSYQRTAITAVKTSDNEEVVLPEMEISGFGTSGTPTNDHFGISLFDTNQTGLKITLNIKCYDSTGKDLQITSAAHTAKINGVINSPEQENMLTTASLNDLLFIKTAGGTINGGANNDHRFYSLNPLYANYVEDNNELKQKGSEDGNVVSLDLYDPSNTYYSIYSMQFGRELAADEINEKTKVTLKLKVDGGATNIFLFSADNITRIFSEGIMIGESEICNKENFAEIELDESKINKLLDVNGNFSGLTFVSAPVSTESKLLFDEAKFSQGTTVKFMDSNLDVLKEIDVETGLSFNQQAEGQIPVIEKPGFEFKGWSLSANGVTLYNFDEIITDSIKLYPIFEINCASYEVKIGVGEFWDQVVSRLPVSNGAESVYFEYEVIEKQGSSTHFGMSRGAFDNATSNNSYINAWTDEESSNKMLQPGSVYKIIYYLDQPARMAVVSCVNSEGIDVTSEIPACSINGWGATGVPTNDHFGITLISVNGIGIELKLSVKCYDSLGKDLQVTCGTVVNQTKGVISEPEENTKLTSASINDLLFVRNPSGMINGIPNNEMYHLGSLNPSLATYVENDKAICDMGSEDGNAVSMKVNSDSSDEYFVYDIKFGRSLDLSKINQETKVFIKLAIAGAQSNMLMLFSPENTQRLFENAVNISSDIINNNGKFVQIELSLQDLDKIKDSEGMFSGITFVMSAVTGGECKILLDEIFISEPVNVVFLDSDNETMLDRITVKTGFSFNEQYSDVLPKAEKEGFKFIGWSIDKNSINLYDFNKKITDPVTLYPVFEKEISDYSEFEGMYYNSEENKSFILKSDKTVETQDYSFSTYRIYGSIIEMDDGSIGKVESGKIVINGKTYLLIEYFVVIFNVDNNEVYRINVPKGAKVTEYEGATKENYKFEYWYINDENKAFDFNTPIIADMVLKGKFIYNEVDSYSEYAAWYIAEDGKIIILNDNKTADFSLNGGDIKIISYRISKEKNIEFDNKGTVINAEIEENGIIYDNKLYSKLSEYIVTFNTLDGTKINSVTVGKETGYKIDISSIGVPMKEGFVFVNWKLGSEVFDENNYITENITLVAEYRQVESPSDNNSGCFASFNVSSLLLVLVLSFLCAVIIIINKKIKNH